MYRTSNLDRFDLWLWNDVPCDILFSTRSVKNDDGWMDGKFLSYENLEEAAQQIASVHSGNVQPVLMFTYSYPAPLDRRHCFAESMMYNVNETERFRDLILERCDEIGPFIDDIEKGKFHFALMFRSDGPGVRFNIRFHVDQALNGLRPECFDRLAS